tara:strand:- start:3274 stop:3504 length:231 start_codon:yes stop_codon:yes gene_type:complete
MKKEYKNLLKYKVEPNNKNYKMHVYEIRIKLQKEITELQTIMDTYDAANIPTINQLETEGYRLSQQGIENLINTID